MKTKFAALTALALLCAAAAGRAASVSTNLFVEAFSTATGQWSGTSGFKSDRVWTKEGTVYGALGGAKLGTGSKTGTLTSETIPLRLENAEATLSIHVQAAGYPGKSGHLSLKAVDASDIELAAWTTNLVAANVSTATDLSDMASASSFDFAFDFTTSVPFRLVLATGGGDPRVLVGEVRVTETYEEQTDPWAPVWTISPFSATPIVGNAFSFAVSAALADGTPQSVLCGGLQPSVSGTQPTFTGGVFSWTPDADAAGDYAAAFSVQNDGGAYTTNVAFTVKGLLEEEVLFFEPFSGSANNSTSWASNAQIIDNGAFVANIATNAGWTGTTGLRKAPSSILFGTATTASGTATTPSISLLNGVSSGEVSISFHAATKNANRSLTMSVLDANGSVIASKTYALATLDTTDSNLDAYETDASGSPLAWKGSVTSPFRLSFASAQTDSCLFLDSVNARFILSLFFAEKTTMTGIPAKRMSVSGR